MAIKNRFFQPNMNVNSTINYKSLMVNAMHLLIKKVLQTVENNKKIGENYFCISFYSNFNGVVIPSYIKDKYPGEMTIFLQHQFYDLKVHEESFEVKLSFYGNIERVVIPFSAITSFIDPVADIEIQCSRNMCSMVLNGAEVDVSDDYCEMLKDYNLKKQNVLSYDLIIDDMSPGLYGDIWSMIKKNIMQGDGKPSIHKIDTTNWTKGMLDSSRKNGKIIPINAYRNSLFPKKK